MSHEAPASAARNSALKEEARRKCVFCLIKMRSVGRIAVRTGNHTKQILEQIYLMRSQVVEIAAARNIRLQSPRHFLAALKVEIARRNREAYLHIYHITDGSALDNLLYLLEIRKITAIVSHKAWNTRLLADAVDADAVVVARSQRFLYVARFARTHRHDGEGGVRRRWRGDVNSIHIGVFYQLRCIRVPFAHMMALSIAACLVLASAHHSHHLRTLHFVESRSALLFGYFSAADKSPINLFHSLLVYSLPKDYSPASDLLISSI